MNKQGPGNIWLAEPEIANRSLGDPILLKTGVHLYNFDIDDPKLKHEHEACLSDKIIPALTANRRATVLIQGSASRSGEDDHNKVLSGARAATVLERPIPKGIRGAQIVDAIALGSPKLGPVEDEGDRAVFLLLSFPLNVEVVSIHTDDWKRELVWDDIVELGGTDRKSIQKINIQLRAWGAPRVWNVDGRDRQVMPDPFPLEAQVQRDRRTIPQNRWSLRMADADVQPADPIQTLYRRSDSAVAWGFVSHDPTTGSRDHRPGDRRDQPGAG